MKDFRLYSNEKHVTGRFNVAKIGKDMLRSKIQDAPISNAITLLNTKL